MTNAEEKLISINAAIAERAERLRALGDTTEVDACVQAAGHANFLGPAAHRNWCTAHALKAQIRDLEAEKHALLQELPNEQEPSQGFSADSFPGP